MRVVAVFALLAVFALPAPAVAQSLVGSSQDCGTYQWDGSLTKGRTDSMVAYYDHTEGCFRYVGFTVIGADRGQMASNPASERAWQTSECQRAGREAVVGHFRYYRGINVSPESVKVRCELWKGGD